jgi:hypothetical protein
LRRAGEMSDLMDPVYTRLRAPSLVGQGRIPKLTISERIIRVISERESTAHELAVRFQRPSSVISAMLNSLMRYDDMIIRIILNARERRNFTVAWNRRRPRVSYIRV